MQERKTLHEYSTSRLDDLDGATIDKAIEILQILKKEGWEALELQLEYDGERSLYPYRCRPENDEEYQKRIKKEQEQKEYRKRHYEELKKEFEEI